MTSNSLPDPRRVEDVPLVPGDDYDDPDSRHNDGNIQFSHKSEKASWCSCYNVFVVVCVTLVMVNNVTQAEISGWFYQETNFTSFFFLTWWSYSMTLLTLPLYLLGYVFFQGFRFLNHCCCSSKSPFRFEKPWDGSKMLTDKKSWLRAVFLAALLSIPQFVSSYSWLASLKFMPASMNTAISQTANLVSFVLSLLLLPQTRVNVLAKTTLVAVGAGSLVILAVGAGETTSQVYPQPWIGVLLDLLQLTLYALYGVLYTKWFPKARFFEMSFLQSVMGLCHCLFWWWGFLVSPYFGEPNLIDVVFVMDKKFVFLFFLLTALLNLTFELLIVGSLVLSRSPVYVTMTLNFGVVITTLIDVILRGVRPSVTAWMAIPVVSLAMLCLNGLLLLREDFWVERRFKALFCGCACCKKEGIRPEEKGPRKK